MFSFHSDSDKSCDACGFPPQEKKLLACSKCKSVSYHNKQCQQEHWKIHKKDCPKRLEAIAPLNYLVEENFDFFERLHEVSAYEWGKLQERWKHNVQLWYQEDYLAAMEGFQDALEIFMLDWAGATNPTSDATESDPSILPADALEWANRLLFCAYCELDGQQIQMARRRLAICITILSSIESSPRRNTLMNDAWMELLLSYEETNDMVCARHVAHMAIQRGACGWTLPYQRPGYMVKQLPSVSYTPSDQHPDWCGVLENHWQRIRDEYSKIQYWSQVGCADRGSGETDHRVVDKGDWNEYVLFGTGARDEHVSFTKQLLREHVPDAVSLAQLGGGEVIFSKLAARTHIQAHCGPTNVRWTAHLGLVIPKQGNCKIRVAHEWHNWQEGKMVVFDDSYEHEVRNDTDEERVVLLLRFWHPELQNKYSREESLMEAQQKKQEATEKRYHPPA
jgi:aspartyl/asparaginyl beta-hydroxylase (cupin superfamily)